MGEKMNDLKKTQSKPQSADNEDNMIVTHSVIKPKDKKFPKERALL